MKVTSVCMLAVVAMFLTTTALWAQGGKQANTTCPCAQTATTPAQQAKEVHQGKRLAMQPDNMSLLHHKYRVWNKAMQMNGTDKVSNAKRYHRAKAHRMGVRSSYPGYTTSRANRHITGRGVEQTRGAYPKAGMLCGKHLCAGKCSATCDQCTMPGCGKEQKASGQCTMSGCGKEQKASGECTMPSCGKEHKTSGQCPMQATPATK
ncbi:MAG: hypothetical protein ACYDBB_06180 [Armatimonadota bacterium]